MALRFESLIVAITLLLAGCAGEGPTNIAHGSEQGSESAQEGTINLTGSSTLGPLVLEIGKRFEKKHSKIRVDVQTGGSSRGIADTATGIVDIGMSSRKLRPSEEPGMLTWTIAVDGITFIINADNPVKKLNRKQLRNIYTGQTTNWLAVGGRDAEITVINRADGRSEVELVTKYLGINPADIAADLLAGENQQGIKMVASDVNAITYMSVGTSAYESKAGTRIKLLPLGGVTATVAHVASGDYPLSRPLLFVTTSQPSPLIQSFVDFCQSSAAHDLIEEFSYVPVQP